MRYPNKIISYSQSIIPSFPEVLSAIRKAPLSPDDLYKITVKAFADVGEFVEALDCLYAMGYIEYDRKTGRLQNVM